MPILFLSIADDALREAVAEQIAAAKLPTPHSVDAAQAAQKMGEEGACLIIIDHLVADQKLASFLRARGDGVENPTVLLLGGEGDIEGVTESFATPLRLGHLVTRLRYYLQTAPLLRNKTVSFGPYRLEPQNRRILCEHNPEPIRLTEKETALLVFLSQSKQPATRQDILATVWGYDERIDTHTLETHIYQLRRKLESTGKEGGGENWLINEAGAYRLARGAE